VHLVTRACPRQLCRQPRAAERARGLCRDLPRGQPARRGQLCGVPWPRARCAAPEQTPCRACGPSAVAGALAAAPCSPAAACCSCAAAAQRRRAWHVGVGRPESGQRAARGRRSTAVYAAPAARASTTRQQRTAARRRARRPCRAQRSERQPLCWRRSWQQRRWLRAWQHFWRAWLRRRRAWRRWAWRRRRPWRRRRRPWRRRRRAWRRWRRYCREWREPRGASACMGHVSGAAPGPSGARHALQCAGRAQRRRTRRPCR